MIASRRIILLNLLFLVLSTGIPAQNKKSLTIEDLMTFRHLESPGISSDGNWVFHVSKPDRGDPRVLVYSTDGSKKYTLDLASEPKISPDGNWVVVRKEIPLLKQVQTGKKDAGSTKRDLLPLNRYPVCRWN